MVLTDTEPREKKEIIFQCYLSEVHLFLFRGSSQLQIIFPGMQSHGENKQTNQTSYGKVLLRAWQITTECNRGSTNDLACTKPGPLGQKFEASEVPEAMSLIFPPLAPKPLRGAWPF
jgi:hypothetical protein